VNANNSDKDDKHPVPNKKAKIDPSQKKLMKQMAQQEKGKKPFIPQQKYSQNLFKKN